LLWGPKRDIYFLFFPDLRQLATEAKRWQCSGNEAMQLTAVYSAVPEGYIAIVEELPGANTQGATLEEARENLQEAVALVLEANRELAEQSLQGRSVTGEAFVLHGP
jgi:predicted RNase H-like HicB family nuclease